MIDQIFDKSEDPYTVLVKLYRVAIPEWDSVKTVGAFPQISRETALYILDCYKMKFNQGDGLLLWMNNGFGSSYNRKPWHIDNSRLKLTFE